MQVKISFYKMYDVILVENYFSEFQLEFIIKIEY